MTIINNIELNIIYIKKYILILAYEVLLKK